MKGKNIGACRRPNQAMKREKNVGVGRGILSLISLSELMLRSG